jgi:hypothetical protein
MSTPEMDRAESTSGVDPIESAEVRARFADLVAGAGLDLPRLSDRSRIEGGRLRSRRRALTLTGCATAASVLTCAGWAVGVGTGPTEPGTVAAGPTAPASARPTAGSTAATPGAPRGPVVPVTGRATAAALLDVVGRLQRGTASDVGGQGGGPAQGAPVETYATFQWTPAGGGAATPVQINVQPDFHERGFFSCSDPERVACSVIRQSGTVVVAYETHQGAAVDRYVDVHHTDTGVRVVVGSTNASVFEKGTAVRRRPPLSSAQLRTVAGLPFWGETIPAQFARSGAALSPYHDFDTEARPTAQPDPAGGVAPSATPAS